MNDPDGYFGEPIAAGYDDPSDRMFQPEAIDPAVGLLANLAGSGRALELAIGTGRIGLPLSQRGVAVHGIELSRAMVAKLRGKPGGEAIDVTIGDMATTTCRPARTSWGTGQVPSGSSATAMTMPPSSTAGITSRSSMGRGSTGRSRSAMYGHPSST